ncbi:hypothetical protein [Rhodococcus sovatensis]|uniref:Uncharacterized protein n=1 Tax=Rhodococcus sovatensis TaxID=1805840 RepID=A0ABZ2PIG5_9NOCA
MQDEIADGASILSYVRDPAVECAVAERIDYGIKVLHASWGSAAALWTEIARTTGRPGTMCSIAVTG